MPALALLAPGTVAAARLADAVRDQHALVPVSSWANLNRALTSGEVEGAVFDPYDRRGILRLSDLRRLRATHPRAALIVFAGFDGRELDLFHLGRLEMDGILEDRGPGATRMLRDRIEQALDNAFATRVSLAAHGRLRPIAVRCLACAIKLARQSGRTEDLAAAMGMSEKALRDALREGALPTARRFLLWGRLLEAAYLMERTQNTVEDTAFRVRYSTAAALRSAFRRALRTSPRRISEGGGWRRVLDAAVERLGGRPDLGQAQRTVM